MPEIIVRIPTPLRGFSEGASTVAVKARTAGEALETLVQRHPALRQHLFDESGSLRSFVNIFRNDEDIRYLSKGNTQVTADDELSIVPSIAGGNQISGT